MKVEGLQKLVAQLKAKAAKANKGHNVSCVVGYSAGYALHVHENLEAKHPRGGQAKFLEQPARQFAKEIGDIVTRALKEGKTLAQALLLGGLKLQRESQPLVPVDTGNLRASAFTRLEET